MLINCLISFADEQRQVIGRYTKNFLPILANLIAPVGGDKGDASRLSALETLKCYLKVANQKVGFNHFWGILKSKSLSVADLIT